MDERHTPKYPTPRVGPKLGRTVAMLVTLGTYVVQSRGTLSSQPCPLMNKPRIDASLNLVPMP